VSLYKRGKRVPVYWYKFMWDGVLIRKSTRQGNHKVARQMEAAHRTSLAKGEVGIRDKKRVPTLAEFCKSRLEPWAKATFEQTVRNSWLWYRDNIRVIEKTPHLGSLKLDAITNEHVADFASSKLQQSYAVSTINSTIRVLRRALRLALEWHLIESAPILKLLSGENHREHVVTHDEGRKYLTAADQELAAFMVLEFDSGLRPDEAYSLRWEHINWGNGKNGSLFVAHGKTPAARRVIHLSDELRFVLEHRWEMAGSPAEGWVWLAPTKSGHFEESTLKKRHRNAIQDSKVRPFVIYSARHTFLTRLGESGCDAWTLARIAGHSDISISMRYVHPSEAAVSKAMSNLGGHVFRHSTENTNLPKAAESPVSVDSEEFEWRARRDSNSRPIAPEAIALSN
jgi:integrase